MFMMIHFFWCIDIHIYIYILYTLYIYTYSLLFLVLRNKTMKHLLCPKPGNNSVGHSSFIAEVASAWQGTSMPEASVLFFVASHLTYET